MDDINSFLLKVQNLEIIQGLKGIRQIFDELKDEQSKEYKDLKNQTILKLVDISNDFIQKSTNNYAFEILKLCEFYSKG